MEVPSQKVIIPKGMVNPLETTIIEIPKKLQDKPAVIAKPKISTFVLYDRNVDGEQNLIQSEVRNHGDFALGILNKKQKLNRALSDFLTNHLDVENNTKTDSTAIDIENRKKKKMCAEIEIDKINVGKKICQRGSEPLTSYKKNKIESIDHTLRAMEIIELNRIQEDLKNFQAARRKLIFNATNIGTS